MLGFVGHCKRGAFLRPDLGCQSVLRPAADCNHGAMHTPQNPVPVPDAAVIGGVSERTVWYLLARGDLTRWRAGHRTLVDADELVDKLAPRAA